LYFCHVLNAVGVVGEGGRVNKRFNTDFQWIVHIETGGDNGPAEGVVDFDPLVPLLDAEGCCWVRTNVFHYLEYFYVLAVDDYPSFVAFGSILYVD
jgi:hypothetical protein